MVHKKGFWLIAFLAILVVNVFSVSSVQAFSLISEQQEINMGRSVGRQLEKQYGLVDDPALQERVTRIGMKLVAVCDRPNLPYTFRVLNSNEVNAMALPGGFVYIFKGLIDKMPSDDELAGVIGHEIGHVVKRHSVGLMEKNIALNLATIFAAVRSDDGMILSNIASMFLMAKYSREDEQEADYLGFVHSLKAGYNPYSMLIGLTKLSSMDQDYQYDLLSDHPESQERIKKVKEYLAQQKITPGVAPAADGKGFQIVDGAWQLPPLYQDYGGYTAQERLYFAAGILYRLSQLPDYDSDKFIVDSDGTNATVYYDETPVLLLTPDDASFNGTDNPMELAGQFVDRLTKWKVVNNKKNA